MRGARLSRVGKLASTGLGAAGVVWAQPALSQAATPPAAVAGSATTAVAGAATTDGAQGADIIVTATKRNERLQDVPVSVAVVGPALINQTGSLTTTQLPNLAPGLSYAPSGQPKLSSFFVRGVGTYALSPALEASVGVAVDGVPMARIGGSISDLVDIDHVEVLKGPQGMLFGKNATAGLISIITNKPRIDETSVTGHVSYGSYDEVNADAAINYSPSDKGAFRLTAWRFGHDGFVRGVDGHKYGDKNSYGVRLGITVRPTDALTFTLMGQYDGRDENGIVLADQEYTPQSNPLLVAYKNSIGIVPSRKNRLADFYRAPFVKGTNFAITGLTDLELGGGYTLSSVTSFRDIYDKSSYDPFGQGSPLIHLDALLDTSHYHQFTQELRIASPTENRLSFVAGLFYYDFSIDNTTNSAVTGLVQPGISRYNSFAAISDFLRNYAAFGEATFRVLPGLRLIGGIRQSRDRTGGTFIRYNLTPPVGIVPGSIVPLAFTPKNVTYNFTSYRAGVQADLARDVMVYATASRGYKAPGFNLTTTLLPNQLSDNTNVNAETVRSYEAGIKSQFLDRRLTVNITGFHSIFSNFQTTVAPGTPPQFLIQNAKQLKSDGVEFEVIGRPTPALSLGVNGAYIHARYTDYNNAPCYVGEPTGTTFAPNVCVGGVQSLNGFRVPLSSKWSINANARYEMAVGSSLKAFVGGDYSYRSTILYEGTHDPHDYQPGYGVLNLTAGIGPHGGSWTASVYGRNVLKQYFVSRVRDFSSIFQHFNAYEAQRRIGVQLEVKY